MSNQDDTLVARAVVENRLATPDEVRLSLKIQAALSDKGQKMALRQILVQKGFATAGQITRVTQAGTNDDSMARATERIPGYHILGKLGQGAMATVFKARQLSLDRIVAIKVLPKRLSENPEFVDRFYKEGKAAARLNHPNIVQAIDVGEAQGYHYFVMEYVEGKTLYDDLAKGKVYSEAEALDIIIQVARALKHAHRRGLIHRDVKPKNIMITKEGVVKLADMGLARAMDDKKAAEEEAGQGVRHAVLHQPRADPRRAGHRLPGRHLLARRDVLPHGHRPACPSTGRARRPSCTSTSRSRCCRRTTSTPRLSAGTAEVIEVMMAKDRNKRYASTEDLLKDLQAVQKGEPPLQARQRVDPKLLQSFAKAEKAASTDEEMLLTDANTETVVQVTPRSQLARLMIPVFILVLVFLGLSLAFNIFFLIRGG